MKIIRTVMAALFLANILSATAHAQSAPQASSSPEVLRVSILTSDVTTDLRTNFPILGKYLEKQLGVKVQYIPTATAEEVVDAIATDKIDLAWLGGLTYVQAAARSSVIPLVQRDEDSRYTSVFITTLPSAKSVKDLAGTRFLFGTIFSTTGSLMPRAYLKKAGIVPEAFFKNVEYLKGKEGYDLSVERLLAGQFDSAAVSSAYWESLKKRKPIDSKKLRALDITPIFYDYSWVARGSLDKAMQNKIVAAFLKLDSGKPEEKAILDLQRASQYIPSFVKNYRPVDAAARDLGLIK